MAPSQTMGAGQSSSERQATQRPSVASHLGRGARQSLSEAQGEVVVHWPAPAEVDVQLWPLGQPFLGAVPHPGWQRPPVPLQASPESTAPQL